MMDRLITVGLLLGFCAVASHASAQGFGASGAYPMQSGEALYKGICQGCHMPDGKGASGAGVYPALAGDKRLAAKAYATMVVLRGQKAMPAFGPSFSDAQVAAVVNYVRTQFGNAYKDGATLEEVKALRAAMAPKALSDRPPG